MCIRDRFDWATIDGRGTDQIDEVLREGVCKHDVTLVNET